MVPMRTLMVFRDSQHDQHGKQNHQQTHNLHGGVCGKHRASRCAFNYHPDLLIQWLQTDIPLKVTNKKKKKYNSGILLNIFKNSNKLQTLLHFPTKVLRAATLEIFQIHKPLQSWTVS